jgi:soluble lytic murein transglycosylase
MSDTNRQTARWRYWAARAAEQNQELTLARQLYNSVLIDDNYYAAMAAARLDVTVHPHPEKLVRDQTLLTEIQQLPALVRARELLLCNLRPQADIEWQYGFSTLSEEARNQAIHLASAWGWHDQAVATASQRRVFNDYHLLYPRPYDKEVSAGAKLAKLQPELIYGVLRQESLYRANAISSAGARGLLQLLPETARRTAQSLGRPKPSVDDLYVPSINVQLGAAQLRRLIDRFGGQTAVALAGYNAGPNAARRWLPSQSIDPDIWVENIPYNETRGYVQRVLWHSVVFAWLRSGEPQRTESWLARIAPAPQSVVLSRD